MLRSRRFVKFVISIIRSPLERRDRVSSSHCCDCVLRLRDPSRIQGKLSLRYSFFWLSLSVVILIAAISSGFIGAIGDLFGSVLTTNFVFFLGLFLLLAFLPMLSVIATKQAANIKNLTQRLAIIEKEIVRDC